MPGADPRTAATPSPARVLAQAAAATHWDTTPAPVRQQALDLMADTFAVIAAGARHPSIYPAMQRLRGDAGPCTVIGHGAKAASAAAALVNGAATTVLQLQDGHRVARGHPMSHVLPAAFAVAQETGAGVEDFLSAVVAGYEAAARVGRALGGLQDLLHDAGTFGTLGAAVAVARLVAGPDAAVLEQAIEGSAAVALFPYRHTVVQGATVHHLYIGLGASTGVTAGKAAAHGLTGLPGTLESFFGPRAGAAFDSTSLLWGVGPDARWRDYELLQAYFKLYPTCAHLNGINDALLSLLQAEVPDPAAIAAVDVAVYGTALDYNNPTPANDLAARFSMPYAVAIALVKGALDVGAITDAALADPRVRDLAARVVVRHDPALDAGYPAGRPSRVTITLQDGSQRTAEATVPRGDVGNPLSAAERRHKVLQLLAVAYGEDRSAAIADAVQALPQSPDLGALAALLEA